MSFLNTDHAVFSDELSMTAMDSQHEWWNWVERGGVGMGVRSLDMLETVDSTEAISLGAEDRKATPKTEKTLLMENTNDIDPLTGGSLSAALVMEAPAYPGYLLRYTPGFALESRPAVAQWQAQMQRRGWNIDVDGLYGPASERVARAFQLEKGLTVDGIIGPQTWKVAFDESTITAPVEQSFNNIDTNVALSGRINEIGLNLIKDFEGLRLNAYQDAVGVWTIGYGHTSTAYPGQRITTTQATALLRQDVANFENAVTRAVRVPITENQFAALVSFAYNVGSGALNSSTLLRKLNAGDTFGAANEFLRWNRAGGRVLAGLTRRREAERSLFLS